MDIEEIAVERVKREILKYDCLKYYINTNDKTPMWDGEIYIYKENSKNRANKDFRGKISVQIKGHKVTKIKSNILAKSDKSAKSAILLANSLFFEQFGLQKNAFLGAL